jgi:hypothetical protein
MKKVSYDMRDDEIRILGDSPKLPSGKPGGSKWLPTLVIVLLLILSLVIFFEHKQQNVDEGRLAYFEKHIEQAKVSKEHRTPFGRVVDDDVGGFCEIKDTIINDILLKIYIPHNADMKLHIGRIPQEDESVIYVAQAADVRADNGGIVGAFVLNGKPLAWGLSKKGYCAAINGDISIGVAENTHLFEKATEENGYFFRQYPLVDNGRLVENEPKGKSVRRAICDRIGEIFMVETYTTESFHDFSQALVDLGVDNAVYLVGSSAYGWAVDENGERHEWGILNIHKGRHKMPKNTSYIVWRKR